MSSGSFLIDVVTLITYEQTKNGQYQAFQGPHHPWAPGTVCTPVSVDPHTAAVPSNASQVESLSVKPD